MNLMTFILEIDISFIEMREYHLICLSLLHKVYTVPAISCMSDPCNSSICKSSRRLRNEFHDLANCDGLPLRYFQPQ